VNPYCPAQLTVTGNSSVVNCVALDNSRGSEEIYKTISSRKFVLDDFDGGSLPLKCEGNRFN